MHTRAPVLVLVLAALGCGSGRPPMPDAAPVRYIDPEEAWESYLRSLVPYPQPEGPQSEEPRWRRYCTDDGHCPGGHVCLPLGGDSGGLTECFRYCEADSECRADEMCVCGSPACAVPHWFEAQGTNYCAGDAQGKHRLWGRLVRWREAARCE